ncbi:MAG: cytochrome P450 [Solirubrobacteraceae bacterium]
MISSPPRTVGTTLRPASPRDAAAVLADVLVPLVAEGLIIRRPRTLNLLDRWDAQRRAVRRLQRLHDRYGPGPVPLGLPGRSMAIVVSADHARSILHRTPHGFAADNREKRAALSRFEPHGVLVSSGPQREERRRYNEEILETGRAVHRLGEAFVATVDAEAARIIDRALGAGALTWRVFAIGWWRIVRRIVLGDAAGEDVQITDDLARLRADANWGPFKPHRDALRERFLARLRSYVARAQPGSLAAEVAAISAAPGVDPVQQIPQWLFAFDGAGMATFRTLALLDAHPQVKDRLRTDLAAEVDAPSHPMPLLRACVLESLRLWPTTPAILRDTMTETVWETGTLPAGTALVIFVPYFQRDDRTVDVAHRFSPEGWLGEESLESAFMAFSLGPAQCPGRNLVLLVTSALLARLLTTAELTQCQRRPLRGDRPLPATLSPFRLAFATRRTEPPGRRL